MGTLSNKTNTNVGSRGISSFKNVLVLFMFILMCVFLITTFVLIVSTVNLVEPSLVVPTPTLEYAPSSLSASAPSTSTKSNPKDPLREGTKKKPQRKGPQTQFPVETCEFRKYASERYYHLNSPLDQQPHFLTRDATYIRGTYPTIVTPSVSTHIEPIFTKICIDTSAWEPNKQLDGLPYTDGHNPSIVSISNLHSERKNNRIHLPTIAPIFHFFHLSEEILQQEQYYVGTIVLGESQCRWTGHPANSTVAADDRPPTFRTLFYLLDEHFHLMGNAVPIEVELDADWGTTRNRLKKQIMDTSSSRFQRKIVHFDDTRLFFYDGSLHILYRNGPMFGYHVQVQNKIHMNLQTVTDSSKNNTQTEEWKVYIKASETFTVCCGRNIAMISHYGLTDSSHKSLDAFSAATKSQPSSSVPTYPLLQALTWIDPVTSQNVFKKDDLQSKPKATPSKLAKKSFIHGTNGQLIPLESTFEWLGIAHFHRPEHRQTSTYAKHGHHYTHAFFTIQHRSTGNNRTSNSSDEILHMDDYQLSRISNEFVFASPSLWTMKSSNNYRDNDLDGDIIQFASGLDLIGSDRDGQLLISFGVNDCEGAVMLLNVSILQEMLIHVSDGQEVIDLMMPLLSPK